MAFASPSKRVLQVRDPHRRSRRGEVLQNIHKSTWEIQLTLNLCQVQRMATLDHHGGTSRVRMSALTFPLFPCCTPIPEDKKPWLQYFEADTEKQGGGRRHSHLFHPQKLGERGSLQDLKPSLEFGCTFLLINWDSLNYPRVTNKTVKLAWIFIIIPQSKL